MQILYDSITKLAEQTFGKDVTVENISEYQRHWISCAESLRAQFQKQGLNNTAAHLNGIIETQLGFIRD